MFLQTWRTISFNNTQKYVLLHFTDLPLMSCSIPDGLFRMFEQGTIRLSEYEELDGGWSKKALNIFCQTYLGCDPRERVWRDIFGFAPLSHAISNSQELVAESLVYYESIHLNKSADTEYYNEWTRPIGMAVRRGYIGVVEQLLSKDRGERFSLDYDDAMSLLEHAETLSDSSIKRLLEDYIERLEESGKKARRIIRERIGLDW
ncbi:unnamed protein product [Alternaria alternata]